MATFEERAAAAFKSMKAFKEDMLTFKENILTFKGNMLTFKEEVLTFKDDMLTFKDEVTKFTTFVDECQSTFDRCVGEIVTKAINAIPKHDDSNLRKEIDALRLEITALKASGCKCGKDGDNNDEKQEQEVAVKVPSKAKKRTATPTAKDAEVRNEVDTSNKNTIIPINIMNKETAAKGFHLKDIAITGPTEEEIEEVIKSRSSDITTSEETEGAHTPPDELDDLMTEWGF